MKILQVLTMLTLTLGLTQVVYADNDNMENKQAVQGVEVNKDSTDAQDSKQMRKEKHRNRHKDHAMDKEKHDGDHKDGDMKMEKHGHDRKGHDMKKEKHESEGKDHEMGNEGQEHQEHEMENEANHK
jgi:hypothetical protein